MTFCYIFRSTMEERHDVALSEHNALVKDGYNVTNVTIPGVDRNRNLYIYAGITASLFLFGLLRVLLTFYILVSSAKQLHHKMLAAITRCPILFFDTNPIAELS